MEQFAEDEIVLPTGPYAGRRLRLDRQPFARLWLRAVDSLLWTRHCLTAPSQSGKTLLGSVIPICYHLFEVGETVIYGVPQMEMGADKWREDLLPVIERTRYRDLLPRGGAGSRGGKIDAIKFRNGATLKFMSGGAGGKLGDKARAGFTGRVLGITEVDGMDESGGGSHEADKISQLEARTKSFGRRRRHFLECTCTVKQGRIWTEYENGTQSRIVVPCPECDAWVTPEREHLVGWENAETELAARSQAAFCCPACGAAWDEETRQEINQKGRLLHKGQSIDKHGQVIGEPPATDTLGFRWNAFNNLFQSTGDIAADEWKGRRAENQENAEKSLRQFVWAIPYEPPATDTTPLEVSAIQRRTLKGHGRGVVPNDAEYITAHVDLGKWLLHYLVAAWRLDGSGHVIDYGRLEVPSGQMEISRALLSALREFRDLVQAGWKDSRGEIWTPEQVWVDAGWESDVAYLFCEESDNKQKIWRPAIGRGEGQQYRAGPYSRPKSTGTVVRFIGEEYHIAKNPKRPVQHAEVNADHWKSRVHDRLSCPANTPGAITIYEAPPNDHLALAKHWTSEKQEEEFIAGRGTVRRWRKVHRNNHWLDNLYNAAAAAHLCGQRLISVAPVPTAKASTAPQNGAKATKGRARRDDGAKGDGWFASRKK